MSNPPIVPILKIYAGDTFTQSFVFETDGVPRNLVAEGWGSWLAQIRVMPESTTSVPFVIDTTQASVGRITLSLTAATTATLVGDVFDLQATRTGEVRTFLQGSLTVSKDVSRA
jgi:hypothetical protein